MTKERNLLLVSLFLVFGLVAMAPCVMAQVAFNESIGTNLYGRPEGLAEATGAVTLTSQATGTLTYPVSAGSFFTVTYSANITSAATVSLYCTGLFIGTAAGNGCGNIGTPTVTNVGSSGVVKLPVSNTMNFSANIAGTLSLYVRVNANKHGPGIVTASTTATFYTGSNATMGTLSPNWVLTINPYTSLNFYFGEFYKTISQAANVTICLGVIKDNSEYKNHFVLNVAEAFPYVLTTEAFEVGEDPDSSGSLNGTTIIVSFANVPAGFGIAAETPIPCTAVASTSPLYCAGGNLLIADATPGAFEGPGTATFTYGVTSVDAGFAENVNLPYKIWSAGPLGTGGLPDITASVQLGPIKPTTDIPLFAVHPSNVVIGGVVSGTTLNVVEFNNCITNLLWPFVTVNGAWDSAVAVSNTTMDPLWTSTNALLAAGSAVQQTGSCNYNFYSGGNQVAQWNSTIPVAAGATEGYDMAGVVPKGFAGNGYVYATCAFSNAHGYAYIVNSWGASSAVFGNYLAEIIPDPEWNHRDTNGDGLGEGATTPVNIQRRLLKLLFYGLEGGR